jgi:hypothetical protein
MEDLEVDENTNTDVLEETKNNHLQSFKYAKA